jgi:putative tricarboxylic transport membrane protein
MILGLVLGVICESNLRRSYIIAAGSSLWDATAKIVGRPITGVILLICAAVLLYPVIKPLFAKKKAAV